MVNKVQPNMAFVNYEVRYIPLCQDSEHAPGKNKIQAQTLRKWHKLIEGASPN